MKRLITIEICAIALVAAGLYFCGLVGVSFGPANALIITFAVTIGTMMAFTGGTHLNAIAAAFGLPAAGGIILFLAHPGIPVGADRYTEVTYTVMEFLAKVGTVFFFSMAVFCAIGAYAEVVQNRGLKRRSLIVSLLVETVVTGLMFGFGPWTPTVVGVAILAGALVAADKRPQ